jgi:hypothetical protein
MLAYQAVKWLALLRCPWRPVVFLFFGFPYLIIPLVLAGYLLTVAGGPGLIRLRYSGEERAAVLYLFSLGEQEEGQLGRRLIRRASGLGLALLLVPLLFWGNRYTLVGPEGVEVPEGRWSRQRVSKDQALAVAHSESDTGRVSLCLLLRDGTCLDNIDGGSGHLDGLGRSAERVLDILNGWHVPIQNAPGHPSQLCNRARLLAVPQAGVK